MPVNLLVDFGAFLRLHVADMLGHSSTDTTRIDARIVDKMTESPTKFLEAMLA